uniref:CesA-2 n=1 Tax=Arundo donax TaxID=35708 RepID=A0A0A9DBU1_ARUDO
MYVISAVHLLDVESYDVVHVQKMKRDQHLLLAPAVATVYLCHCPAHS